MIYSTVWLLRTKPDVRAEWQKRGEGPQKWTGALDSAELRGPETPDSFWGEGGSRNIQSMVERRADNRQKEQREAVAHCFQCFLRDLGTTLSHLQVLSLVRCGLADLEGLPSLSSLKVIRTFVQYVLSKTALALFLFLLFRDTVSELGEH